jgi:pimeloyl-ACP methyl ester carboxylesterase
VEEQLLALGYAMAGSAFRNPGYSVKEGIQNTLALTNYFRGHVGNPDRIILWGVSMGGLITQASIEKYSGIYDAGIPMCSLSAGAPRYFDWALGIGLAYDVTLGWPEAWGSVGDVRDDVTWEEVAPIYFAQAGDPANAGKLEFIRLVNDLPAEDFYWFPLPGFWMLMQMNTANRAEIETRAGGPVSQNQDHVYILSEEEIAYLNDLGVDAEALLVEMNARTDIQARRSARKYMERYADPSGEITRPILSLHTRTDSICPVENESAYRETVAAAGKEDMLVQVYTDSVGHCVFTPEQVLAALAAMEHWLDTGTPPDPADASFFPPGAGFLPGYQPPPWPQPLH